MVWFTFLSILTKSVQGKQLRDKVVSCNNLRYQIKPAWNHRSLNKLDPLKRESKIYGLRFNLNWKIDSSASTAHRRWNELVRDSFDIRNNLLSLIPILNPWSWNELGQICLTNWSVFSLFIFPNSILDDVVHFLIAV